MSESHADLPRTYREYVPEYSLVQSRWTERGKIAYISQNNSTNPSREYNVALSVFHCKVNSDQGNHCKVDQDSLTEC